MDHPSRALSEERFLIYEPLTTVTDDAAIDLDVKQLELELSKRTTQGRQDALAIYTHGAFSKSYAELELNFPLPVPIAKDTAMYGKTESGKEVRGQALEDIPQGSRTVKFRYHPSPIQDTWTNCHVGGNPNPNMQGCLIRTGQIEIDDLGLYDYTYEMETDNHNARTLSKFSTKAQSKLYDCKEGCPVSTYQKYYKYYGRHDYADHWVQSAFSRTSTNYTTGLGNAQFSGTYKTDLGYRQAITLGAVYLNLWMYVIKEIEHAHALMCSTSGPCNANNNNLDMFGGGDEPLDNNNANDDDCNNDKMMHAWDKAVAFYIGGAAKKTGRAGYLLFSLAQERCLNFGTCDPTSHYGLMARVNQEALRSFREGQNALQMRVCTTLERQVRLVTSFLTVPLVQGVLLYARENEMALLHLSRDKQEEAQAIGATYSAALMPLLHHCSAKDAAMVHEGMRVGRGVTPSFARVKEALERNYACLGVTCELVGGLVDATHKGQYLDGAEPCNYHPHNNKDDPNNQRNSGKGEPNIGLGISISVVFVVLLVVVSVLIGRHASSSGKEFDGPHSTKAAEDFDDDQHQSAVPVERSLELT